MITAISFSGAIVESTRIAEVSDLLLGVSANFEIRVDGRILFSEPMFPVVELRVALKQWLEDGFKRHNDFEFESMESEEAGIVWLRYQNSGGWRIGSLQQEYLEIQTLSDVAVRDVVNDYVRDIDAWVLLNCGVSVSTFIGEWTGEP
jgi:hypothetical protein